MSPVGERRVQRLHRELLVELGRLTVLVERVVTLADAVGVEDAAADALGHRVGATEARRDAVVVDRLAREVAPESGQVGVCGGAHGDDPRSDAST